MEPGHTFIYVSGQGTYSTASGSVTTTEQLGRAMIQVARQGYSKRYLDNQDINSV